jgi:hypothetical protein
MTVDELRSGPLALSRARSVSCACPTGCSPASFILRSVSNTRWGRAPSRTSTSASRSEPRSYAQSVRRSMSSPAANPRAPRPRSSTISVPRSRRSSGCSTIRIVRTSATCMTSLLCMDRVAGRNPVVCVQVAREGGLAAAALAARADTVAVPGGHLRHADPVGLFVARPNLQPAAAKMPWISPAVIGYS